MHKFLTSNNFVKSNSTWCVGYWLSVWGMGWIRKAGSMNSGLLARTSCKLTWLAAFLFTACH